jgi:anti-anti-sigma factor
MDPDDLQVTTRVEHGDVLMAVRGYLDAAGGERLARQTREAAATGHACIRIDLGAVKLFNCSGARRLVAAIEDIGRSGPHVELVGARRPLQRALEIVA